jgi:predicted transcriptional regulator
MSPRAACRLTRLGYDVYDYTLGKADWLATGLPTEGTRSGPPRVLDAVDTAVPMCRLDEMVDVIANRFASSRWQVCVVVDERRVILGKLRLDDLPAEGSAEEVMEPGPTTIRPSEDLAEVRERMTKRKVQTLLVSTPAGVLVGVLGQSTAR